MRDIHELISDLRRLDIRLSINGDRLRYSAPEGAMTAELRGEISQRKQEILELIQKTTSSGHSVGAPISPVPRDDYLPLSMAQRRLWLLHQQFPASFAYNMPGAFRLRGPLNVSALERCLNEIVRRHETLRTTFTEVDDEPVQIITESLHIPLQVIDLRRSPEAEREVESEKLYRDAVMEPFNLAKLPLLRTLLLKLSAEDHILVVVLHHIVSDGWSMSIMFREMSVLYEAFSNGKPSPLSELPIQYVDYAAWQREWLQEEELDRQLSYWKDKLKDAPPSLDLPVDRPIPAAGSSPGVEEILVLESSLAAQLTALSRQAGVTPFMLLLSAFKVLLHRYTGQEDIVIGSPMANRNRRETEGLIGFLVNTLVFRTDLSGDPSFMELLRRVQAVCLGAYAHQDIPFEKLVAELRPERGVNQNPIFGVFFNFINIPEASLDLSGLKVSPFASSPAESKFRMTMYVSLQNEKASLALLYQPGLFSAQRMKILLRQFQYLLEQIAAAPEAPISSYSMVTPDSMALLPDPAADISEPEYEPITSTFSSWADQTPEHPAVRQGDRIWTYSELNRSARSIAQRLLAQGLNRGDVVAISGPQSFGMIACMMGSFMSGGVMLTLDRNLPEYRQRIMLNQSEAMHLLYIGPQRREDKWMQRLMKVIFVGAGKEKPTNTRTDTGPDLPDILPEDAAYIFFTSGTTGIPKGVLGQHKGISHFLNWQRETFGIRPSDRSAQLTGLSFDVVIRDVFLPLTSGATLCLPAEEYGTLSPDILSWLEHEEISVLHSVPSLANSWLLDLPSDVSLRNLRYVFFAGEPLTDALVRNWRESFPESGEIINFYGPTETTLAKCFYRVPDQPKIGTQPVGSPLPATQALVLSHSNQLCGVGETGEIVLRTPFRSLGYINSSEENQKRFIRNPFRDDDSDLLYYTGDGGRYLPDGSLEILGRLDDQIKLRGIRIEPGEIQTALRQDPRVRDALVIARAEKPGEKYLVAYIVVNRARPPAVGELKQLLRQKLPEYMIPSFFVKVYHFSLTPNGKVDYRLLPEPDTSRSEVPNEFIAPRNDMERKLAEIWKRVLSIDSVGVRDNFFDLGGDSFLALRVFSHIRRVFERNFPLTVLSNAPTIEELANVINQEKELKSLSPLTLVLREGDPRRPVFCIHGCLGGVLGFRALGTHLGEEYTFYGIRAQGLYGESRPHKKYAEMADCYAKEIQSVQPEGPYILASGGAGGWIAMEVARNLMEKGQEVELLFLFDVIYRRADGVTGLEWNRHAPPDVATPNMDPGLSEKPMGWRNWWAVRYLKKRRLTKAPLVFIMRSCKKLFWTFFAYSLIARRVGFVRRRIDYSHRVRTLQAKAFWEYVPKPYSGRIIYFLSRDRKEYFNSNWHELARGGIEIHEMPGEHVAMLGERYVHLVADKMRYYLEEVRAWHKAPEQLS